MLKNYLSLTIIVLLQAILPICLLMLIVPWFINHSSSLIHWQQQLTQMKYWIIAWHSLFYLALFLLWPKLINKLQQKQLTAEQQKIILNSRWYFLAIFIFIDLLMLWR